MEAEQIRGMNKKVDEVSGRLTEMLDAQGVKSIILKGAANALFYPEPTSRQTGDVDIWVEGGQSEVVKLLEKMKMAVEGSAGTLHVHLDKKIFDVEVEVHFTATRVSSPQKNRALQQFLSGEVVNRRRAAAGFYVPGIPYALVMQLSHIKQHLFSEGVGLRQLVDYHQLLQAATEDDLLKVSAQLKPCGLEKMASAVVWVLREVLHLQNEKMICTPDERRGKYLLRVVLEGGNFGWYANDYRVPVVIRWFKDRVRFLRLIPFDASESFWREFFYWGKTICLIPRRVRLRRVALGKR